MEGADFSGYATKADLTCSDGRTITAEAFKHMDGKKIPLVWQHGHDKPENVLGHAILEARDDGMYAYGFFNETSSAQTAKGLVQHDDIQHLSIYANQLKEVGKKVIHGIIREVSLVIAGANPGAKIDQVRLLHSDDPNDFEELEDTAVIFTDQVLQHADVEDKPAEPPVDDKPADETVAHAEGDDKTIKDVLDTLNEEQKNVFNYLIEDAYEAGAESVQHSDETEGTTSGTTDSTAPEGEITHQEGNDNMSRNVFEDKDETKTLKHSWTREDIKNLFEEAKKPGNTLKSVVEEYAIAHSITDIDILFPDAKTVTSGPELISRRMEWVAGVLNGARHTPFSRIKSLAADLTADEARAKGYVKGNLKKEEIIRLLKRVTSPTTIYKKQKLDRDDVVDIVDLDIVAWLKAEMRLMLEEELARAVLIGDGREPDDEDKINEDHIRPIAYDDPMYAHQISIPSNTDSDGIIEAIIRSRKYYKGAGNPVMYTTEDIITDLLLVKNKIGDRVYKTVDDLKATLRVSNIVAVEVMEDTPDLLAVLVNMADYTIGADRGGEVSLFDDFDIDYNQLKYLIETRVSGALTKPKTAVVLKRSAGTAVVATSPTYNATTHVLTIPSVTGVKYYDTTDIDGPPVELTAGTHTLTQTTEVTAEAQSGYSFAHNSDNDWTFPYTA